MCRMFGMVARRAVSVRELLHESPRSLCALSNEHRDGWGIAFGRVDDWQIHRSTMCAAHCSGFAALADIRADLVIAHVRKATVGSLSISNTHPFRRGRFVFAHNGTVHAIDSLRARTAPEHLACIDGDTDSERLFAFVLTHIDQVGDIERGVTQAIAALQALGDIGAASFLLSCGNRLFAYRCGRTLFTLTRGSVAMVASEPLTDEAWCEVAESQLVILDRPGNSAEHPIAA